jgi:hypothetical protein
MLYAVIYKQNECTLSMGCFPQSLESDIQARPEWFAAKCVKGGWKDGLAAARVASGNVASVHDFFHRRQQIIIGKWPLQC